MNCPHCGAQLTSLEINTTDDQVTSIEECLNCGGHVLPPILANFISTNSAKNIDSVLPKATSLPSHEPTCQHCHQHMIAIKDDSVPNNVTVFACPNNHQEFYPKDQLLKFKKAQDAKINYHKLWGIPIKSAFAVLVPVVIIFAAITVIPNTLQMSQTSQEARVKASEILTQPLITPISSTQVLISFSTKNAVKTSIKFTSGQDKTFEVSSEPGTNHLLSVSDLEPQTTYKYIMQIITSDKTLNTTEYFFTTP